MAPTDLIATRSSCACLHLSAPFPACDLRRCDLGSQTDRHEVDAHEHAPARLCHLWRIPFRTDVVLVIFVKHLCLREFLLERTAEFAQVFRGISKASHDHSCEGLRLWLVPPK